ncbi:MAG: hypothetical protein QY323_03745 [Patescibacteria group bacterium]|nr:MAG: hypothetical protein QY323_03745 [Patescibacteria group bacterium]
MASGDTETALQLPAARAMRKTHWFMALLAFCFGWMRRPFARKALKGTSEPKPLPPAPPQEEVLLPAPPLDPKIVRGQELWKKLRDHPASGCTYRGWDADKRCKIDRELPGYMGAQGLTPEDLGISLADLKAAARRIPIAHTRGYMERAGRGDFGPAFTDDLEKRITTHKLTREELGVTPEQIAAISRAENINAGMTVLRLLREGHMTLEEFRNSLRWRNLTAADLGTTEQEFVLYQ